MRSGYISSAPEQSARTVASALAQAESARQCAQLLDDLTQIASADDLDAWAHRILPLKNTLREADARRLEEAFAAKDAEDCAVGT